MWMDWPGASPGSGPTTSSPASVEPARDEPASPDRAVAGEQRRDVETVDMQRAALDRQRAVLVGSGRVEPGEVEAVNSAGVATWSAVNPARWILDPSAPRMSTDGIEIL